MMDFLNNSVMGSTWIAAKTRALVQLDFNATFPAEGMRKDLYLAQRLAREHYVAAPVVDVVAAQLTRLVARGTGAGKDYASVIQLVADDAGHELGTGESH